MILSFWHPPADQCGICWLFVTSLLVNIMLFSMVKCKSVCTLVHVVIVLVFLPLCPTFQLVAIILRSWMSGFILMINLTLLANEIPYVVKSIMYSFFGKGDPLTKLSLLRAYCNSFYGSVVWDLSHSSIDASCAIWRTGLRRIWNLPHTTYCALLRSTGCLKK